jgi:hypothetical protein
MNTTTSYRFTELISGEVVYMMNAVPDVSTAGEVFQNN